MRCFAYAIIYAACLSFSGGVFAGKWELQPKLSASETYFDNITLASDESGQKNKELVTQLIPGFTLSKQTRRLRISTDYSFGYIKYYGKEFSDRTYNRGSASVNSELIRRHLFLNVNAAISQQVVDPSRAFSTNAAVVSNNQTETRTISLQPRLSNRFAQYANSDLSYKYTIIDYSNSTLDSSQQSILQYNLNSGRWFKRSNWYVSISDTRSTRSNASRAFLTARLDYEISRHWKAFLMGRAQRNDYLQSIPGTSPYYINPEAGLIWTASRKLKMEAGGGAVLNPGDLSNKKITAEQITWRAVVTVAPSKRTSMVLGRESAFYGDRKYFDMSLRTRRTNWSANYSETLITPQQLRISSSLGGSGGALGATTSSLGGGFGAGGGFGGSGFSPTGGGVSSGGALNRLDTNDVLLRKRLSVSSSISRRKISLNANAFLDKGEYQTSKTQDKRYGASGGVVINLGRVMVLSNQASAQRYYFNNGSRADNIYSFSSTLSRQIRKNISTSLAYQWRKRSTNSASVRYTAQQVIAKLDVTF